VSNDSVLTASGTVVTVILNQNSLVISEYTLGSPLVLLHTRTITFSNLPITLPQIVTSLSIVRYNGLLYSDKLEFWLRIGSQALLLQELNTTISLSSIGVQSTTSLGGATYNIYASVVWTLGLPYPSPIYVFAGTAGRMASYDGTKWHNY